MSLLVGRNAAGGGPVAALLLAVAACGVARDPHPPAVAAPSTPAESPAVASHPRDPNAGRPARSYSLAPLSPHTLGPFTARAAERTLTAWFGAAENDKAGQDLFAIVLGSDAGPLGPMHSLVHVPANPDLMVVRPATQTSRKWAVVWSAALDRGEVLTTLGVNGDGSPNGAPTEIHQTSDHIAWLDALPTTHGALVVWAEETTSGSANILVDALGANGKPRGVPMRVARGVRRWQAASAGSSVGLATVGGDSESSALVWQPLDEDGHPKGDPARLADASSVGSDVELAPFQGGWLLAWTNLAGEDPQVTLATIDATGRIGGPNAAFEAGGASILKALTSNGRQAGVAWTEPHRRQGDTQVLGVGMVSADGGSIGKPVAAFEIGLGAPPELVATEAGFALLTPARACWAESASRSCSGPFAPTYVRFGGGLDAVQSEPLLVGDPKKPASAGWGLSCGAANRCLALAASSETPIPLFAVDLPARTSPFATPLVPPPPVDAPHLINVRTVAAETSLQDLGATRMGDKTFVATLVTQIEGRRAKRRHAGSAVSTFMIEDDGAGLAEPSQISTRVASIGGVSVAPGADRTDGAIVAWISGTSSGSRATGDVRLAQVSENGRVLRSLRLGSADGDASRVAIAWAGDGWLVAWVDGRDGRDGGGQVYATKVGRQLQHTARNERVTRAAVGAADIALAVRNDIAWIAWGDARESPRDGVADIYATTLHVADGSRAGDEVRVLATARHSRSPVLAALSDSRALVAWIEDAPTGVDALATGLIGCLDRRANVVRSPIELPLGGAGQPASIALASANDEVHAVVARSGLGGDVTLDGIRLGANGAPLAPPWPLVVLDAPASVDVSMAMAGDDIVYSDVMPAPGQRRIRRAQIAWRP